MRPFCSTLKPALKGASHGTSIRQTGVTGPRTTTPVKPVSIFGRSGLLQPARASAVTRASLARRVSLINRSLARSSTAEDADGLTGPHPGAEAERTARDCRAGLLENAPIWAFCADLADWRDCKGAPQAGPAALKLNPTVHLSREINQAADSPFTRHDLREFERMDAQQSELRG